MTHNINSFKTLSTLNVAGKAYRFHSLKEFGKQIPLGKLPFSLKILLENLLRQEDNVAVKKKDIEALANWKAKAEPDTEIQFMPARVLMQDFTGVPCVADLAAMRAAVQRLGGNPDRINPLQPADLVIDHSVQVDHFGSSSALKDNADLEFERNKERYEFLRWGQTAFKNFRVVPPDTGIVHQVNLEFLSHVAMERQIGGENWLYPDTMVGTDSHTTMINGLGCLGWGVGGIEAEAALLGQPCTMLIPQVVGFKLIGKPAAGTTATDLVLMVTQMLRKKGVVGKFVEFYGPGLASLTLADRATIANMAPEYGATCGIFPVDTKTMDYMKLTGRGDRVAVVEAYFKEQGLWYDGSQADPTYTDTLELDLGKVEPALAGPARPQDRVALAQARESFEKALPSYYPQLQGAEFEKQKMTSVEVKAPSGQNYCLEQGAVVITAITSCTNTSNPSVLIAAGLLAKNAVSKGLNIKPWVKSSLAPGSKVVTDYLKEAGLLSSLEALKFHVVGYGCTTCIGNAGPLPDHIQDAVVKGDLAVAAVLSGNRNFEGRIHPNVRSNYLASPPLVVAYAIAGTMRIDLTHEPLGKDVNGTAVYLKDIWPTNEQVADYVGRFVTSQQFAKSYADVFRGEQQWQDIQVPTGDLYKWDTSSTYIKQPPFFDGITATPVPVTDIHAARVLALLGDSVTTDHISPAGSFKKESPAGQYLVAKGVAPKDFNSYGARRGNHEVMVRGTFANVRLKNLLVPGVEGGVTRHLPEGKQMSIFDAAMQYMADKIPTIVIAGKEYGTGSSRDWAAKGPKLQGIRAVIAESFERIHRSNLVGMGILPLQFKDGESAKTLGLTGEETYEILGLGQVTPGADVKVKATDSSGKTHEFTTRSRIDTPNEVEYFRHGGILPYVLRQQLGK
ncbi:aconitate hydratase AcnA [Bdellovibrionota bacterium FG-1]